MIYEFLMEDSIGEQYYKECETKEEALNVVNIFKRFKSTSIIFVYEINENGYNKIYEYRNYKKGV